MTDWSRSNRIDERDEAGRRIANFGADDLAVPANLTGRLRYLDLRGEGAPLWGPSGEALHLAALGGLTTVGQRVRATCKALDARLLVVDSLAGAYGGDENVRALVRAFCADWDKWATNARCAVMLIVGEHCFHEAQLRRRVFRMRLHT